MGERQFGPYRLVRQIAVGGMAEIHLAKTRGIAGFEKYCALKMIHPNFAEDEQFIQMLVDEAKIAVQLSHGNIAQTFDLGRVGDTYYITMEYVDGADLYKVLRRASEQDLDMPLDVCAFIGKEIASALDHAHRKRDHVGKPLGIVHRDVSPQNVLISYSGEVKLVDFGIAKATMKVRQTAVGVIKGKYYYMSPEQAWGDPIDYRSDIFSAGIVIYEMITGQMLYLEEDLHRLLEMARTADIAPPSRLRKGVPPQLERIIMRALAKDSGERYQSAGDLASDLERFLHSYAPVFTASKVAALLRQAIGDPRQVPVDEQRFPSVELRDGVSSTHPLDSGDLIHERAEIRDENSVIFRVADLKQAAPAAAGSKPAVGKPAGTPAVGKPAAAAAPPRPALVPRTTRAADPVPTTLPRIAPKPPSRATPLGPAPIVRPPARARQADEETRPVVEPAPADPSRTDDSGLLTADGHKLDVATWDRTETHPGLDDLENIGERTMVTGNVVAGFMMDVASEEGVDATLVSAIPVAPPEESTQDEAIDAAPEHVEDDGDTLHLEDDDDATVERPSQRIPVQRQPPQPPPALAAKIHAPAVSEIRRPKPSRRTPAGGTNPGALAAAAASYPAAPAAAPSRPSDSLLHQIVSSKSSEPMPVPRVEPQRPAPLSAPFPIATPHAQAQYDSNGHPFGFPAQPPGLPALAQPPSAYPTLQDLPGGYAYSSYASGQSPYPMAPAMAPAAFYPYGSQPQSPLSLSGQMRALEVDEIPSQYKIPSSSRRWLAYVVAGITAVSIASVGTFFIIRSTRSAVPSSGSVHVESMPSGADVYIDGKRLAERTPLTVEGVPLGSRHEVRVELARHQPYLEPVVVPAGGGEVSVTALLKPVTGKLIVTSTPVGGEIWISDRLRGRTPATLTDIDMATAKKIEIRLKGYQPFVSDLAWPATHEITVTAPLRR